MLKVLVAPLDWGLGHATRCIPIIKELINHNCSVIVAASGAQKTIFQEEFPELPLVDLPGFRVKYGKNRAFTLARIITQIPKFLIGVKRENQWLRSFASKEGLDLVISDNRFGLSASHRARHRARHPDRYHDQHLDRPITTIFMTHQLSIKTSLGSITDWFVQKVNYSFIRRFSLCWVPDVPGDDNLAGILSHPSKLPGIALRYIGWLSRLQPTIARPLAFDLLILLSGPEPQRTILENTILSQLTREMGRIALVRGLPATPTTTGSYDTLHAPSDISDVVVHDYLGSSQLAKVISQSKLVLARSGYSTVMDLVQLGRTAIYVPTPGQPEQEYLGDYLEKKGWGIAVRQHRLHLAEAIRKATTIRDDGKPRHTAGNTIRSDASPAVRNQNTLLSTEIERVLALVRSQSAVADFG